MNSATRKATLWVLGAFFTAFSYASFASGQDRDEFGDTRQEFGDVHQTVARISYISGNVSFARGDDPDNWQAADQNVPMSLGDRVYADSRSRAEVQVHGGDSIWLGARTDLAALNLTDDTKQFSVKGGIASFQIKRLDGNEIFEVDTPNAAVTFDQPGNYRIEVDNDGNTRVVVFRGRAVVAAGGGQVGVNRGEEMRIDGIDSPRYDVVPTARRDGWDQWVDGRVARSARSRSYEYVSADVVGADDLDEYGRWEDIPQYGHVWTPAAIQADWAPYRLGHWGWQDPWGWTWLSSEPWGWAPYHYGRWVNWSSRWYWVPVAPSVRYVSYSPALVAFVGGGPGFSASVTIGGGGFVGWFPLAPREPLNPWWGRRYANVNVTNVTYVNKTYVTVVNQNTFVSGGVVTANIVRDRTVLRDVASAQVVRGPIPMVPTREALRVSVKTNQPAAVRPPAAVLARSVVVHSAPPPAPPTFQAKVAVIRENRGAPIEPAAAAKISVSDRGRPQAATGVRPAAAESGHMTLAPRNPSAGGAAGARPEPVAPVRGRPMATAQQPVSSSPVTSGPSSRGPAAQNVEPAPSREIAPRHVPPAPAATAAPGNAAPPERVRPQTERERAVVPTQKPAEPSTGKGRPQTEDWRNRQRPADAARTPAPPEQQNQQNRARGRENVAPPMDRTGEQPGRGREVATPAPKPQRQQEAEQPARGRERGGPPPQATVERPGRGREFPTPAPKPQPEAQRGRVAPSREAAPTPQARPNVERQQQQRPAPQKTKTDKEKEKEKKDEH
jgi:hypothetical protein